MKEHAENMDNPAAMEVCEEKRQQLIDEVTPKLRNNGEVEAVDILAEAGHLNALVDLVKGETSVDRVCRYLLSCVPYVSMEERETMIQVAGEIYHRQGQDIEALRCAMLLGGDGSRLVSIFNQCKNKSVQKQMALLLGRNQIFLQDAVDEAVQELNSNVRLHHHFKELARTLELTQPKSPEEVYKRFLEPRIIGERRSHRREAISTAFTNGFVNMGFCRDKMLCEEDKARRWFSSGDCKDLALFFSVASIGTLYRWDVGSGMTRIHNFIEPTGGGKASEFHKGGALMALGIICSGVEDPFDLTSAYLRENIGSEQQTAVRIGAVLGLGMAYANSKKEIVNGEDGVVDELRQIIESSSEPLKIKAYAALSLGFILIGTANSEIAQVLLNHLMDAKTDLKHSSSKFFFLALGLIFFGTKDRVGDFCEVVRAISPLFGNMVATLIEVCAFVGTGDAKKIHQLLNICSERHADLDATMEFDDEDEEEEAVDAEVEQGETGAGDEEEEATAELEIGDMGGGDEEEAEMEQGETAAGDDGEAQMEPGETGADGGEEALMEPGEAGAGDKNASRGTHTSYEGLEAASSIPCILHIAVLGIGMVAMGEEIGSQMSIRIFNHLLRYGDPSIRRAVPLALAMTSLSNPQLSIMEILSKFSHDVDMSIARNAIFSMGLIGAGTNNARLAAMLRNLASYYAKDPTTQMLVRIAQGLNHMGKGTLTLNPLHSDRQLLCPTSAAAVFAVCLLMADESDNLLKENEHYLLLFLAMAAQPRMLLTLAEDESDPSKLIVLPVQVRVGQAVDVVAHAGKPKTITGFTTQTTPVLLAYGERAELATDEYVSLTPNLEGVVILRKKNLQP